MTGGGTGPDGSMMLVMTYLTAAIPRAPTRAIGRTT